MNSVLPAVGCQNNKKAAVRSNCGEWIVNKKKKHEIKAANSSSLMRRDMHG